MLYHGSSLSGLKVLTPKISHVLESEKAVFASPIFDVAISFLVPWTDEDFEQGSVNGQLYMKEQYKNAFDIFKDKNGSVYSVDESFFSRDPRLTSYEIVSKTSVPVIKETIIPDAFQAIQHSKFVLINFGDLAPWDLSKRNI